MVDPAPAPAPAPSPAPAPAPAPAWHQGIEAEYIGHWQNRGLSLDDPKTIALDMTKAHREAVSKLGVPPEQLLRMPKADAPEAEVRAFHQRLGAPADPKEYDFSAIKYADGETIEPEFADALRATFARRFVPKETALEIAKDLAKFADGDQAKQNADRTAKLEVERAQLKSDWKQDYDANLFVAKQGAKALGLTPEQVTELENVIGYKAIMTAMHRVGVLGKEDRFITSSNGTGGAMTREQATARKADLMQDKAWAAKYVNGDTSARTEMLNLNRIITGDFESAA